MTSFDQTENPQAPDFALRDARGRTVRLSNYRNRKHLVLFFTRGFL